MTRLPAQAVLLIAIPAACLAQNGSIAGVVTNLAGDPVKNAMLTLTRIATPEPPPYITSSDGQGHFVFEDLEPAHYTLAWERPGYLPGDYQGPLNPAPSQKVVGVELKLTPEAVITGIITDDDGVPYPNARVMASRWGYLDGKRRLISATGASSDAEGVFSLSGLPAGTYYVGAQPEQGNNFNAGPKHVGPEEIYVTTYSPGVADPARATAIKVAAGSVIRRVDFRMRKTRVYRIRGSVLGDLPTAAVGLYSVFVNLIPKDDSSGTGFVPLKSDGTFEFGSVPPGAYIVEVAPGDTRGVARQSVVVGESDLEGVNLQLRPGAEIAGKIAVDRPLAQPPGTPPIAYRPTIILSDPDRLNAGGGSTGVKSDGTFEIHKIPPSAFQVEVRGLPSDTYVKSIRFGNQDVTRTPLDMTLGGGGTLTVVLTPHAADISGRVHKEDNSPLAVVTVSLWTPGIPANQVLDFTRTVRTDANGRFKFEGLPPGEYRVAAWEQFDWAIATAPAFRNNFDSQAATVKLNEDDHAQIEPSLIPRDIIEIEASKLR